MTFTLQPEEPCSFADPEPLLTFLDEEEKRVVRIPLHGMVQSGATLTDDERFGIGDTSFRFNAFGFDAFCRALSVPPSLLRMLKKNGLASEVLNDRLLALKSQGVLEKFELVCRESESKVLGVVSQTYVGYSNRALVRDIAANLGNPSRQNDLFPDFGKFALSHAYSHNTVLHLRLTSKETHGVIKGRGGKGDDVTHLGFEASNSMTGGLAVRLSHFVLRLICANGMTSPVSNKSMRVNHSGYRARFQQRLGQRLDEVARGLGKLKKMVELLGAIPFDPERLARHADIDLVYGILPGGELVKRMTEEVQNLDLSQYLDEEERCVQQEAACLAAIPRHIGGDQTRLVFESHWRSNASMFDFVNVFTEQAKSLPPNERVAAEARAGQLATWIAKHRRHFS